MMTFSENIPCANCPYKKDAPLRRWSLEKMNQLVELEKNIVLECDQIANHVCVGWLMDQNNRGLANMRLGLELQKRNVPFSYMLALDSPSLMFEDTRAMRAANYPEIKNER